MKVLVLVTCVLAAVSADYSYHGPLHYPVIHKGVPVDTVEVQHARAAHLAALDKASVHGGHEEYHYDDHHNDHHAQNEHYGYSIQHVSHHHEAPVHHHEAPIYHHAVHQAYETSHVIPAIGHDGKPLDTPEVEAAKAHHFAAHHEALSKVASHGIHAVEHHYRKRRSYHAQHIPIIDKHGVPVEPLEVQHARAEHLAAHASASHVGYAGDSHGYSHGGHADLHENHHGYTVHQKHAPVYGHHGSYHVPKYDYHGHPLDTAEVEHLKLAHFAAHHEANARNSIHHHY